MKKNFLLLSQLAVMLVPSILFAQQSSYDLQRLLKEKKLITYHQKVIPITDGDKQGISATGIIWLSGVNFSTGTIELDLRGKDEFQKSFLGIAFHGIDTVTYDAIYFRPFNFQSTDPVRKIHAVQYISEPEHPWHRLRDEQNGVYEKAVSPAPSPTDWFHARIEVKETQIMVYIDNATSPSLTVNKLNGRKDGMIGIWNVGLKGDFANLVIKK